MRIVIGLGIIMTGFYAAGQDLNTIGTREAMEVSGSASFNAVGYHADGMNYRRDPLQWYAMGNLTFSIMDVQLPFTYRLTNTTSELTDYPQMVALHPKYKWAQAHVGVTTMHFSKYTLAGHQFSGGGVELTPGNWSFRSMAGSLLPGRLGCGSEVGYATDGLDIKATAFTAKDDSIKNNVGSLKAIVPFFDKKLNLSGEYAISHLTVMQISDHPIANQFHQAFNTSLTLQTQSGRTGITFEHVDPGYKTLGGYFFNNDLENLTLDQQWNLFAGKINFNGRVGFQRNNIDRNKTGTSERWVCNASIHALISQRLQLSGNYSNFTTYTRNRPRTDPFYYGPADTLAFYQVTQSGNFMVNHASGNDTIQHNSRLMVNYQVSVINGAPVEVWTGNAAHDINNTIREQGMTFTFNLSRTIQISHTKTYLGPGFQLHKKIGRTAANIGSTFNVQHMDGNPSTSIINHSAGLQFSPQSGKNQKGKMSISIRGNWLQRFETEQLINEANVFLRLGYRI